MVQFPAKISFSSWQRIVRYFISLNSLPAVLVACFTCFFLLGSKSFWIDETFSFYISHNTSMLLSTMWNEELNMWFYYFLLHFWLSFNHSVLFIRSFSAIFAVASVTIFYQLGKLIYNKQTASIASILLAINMFFVFYAQDARSYTLMFFLICVSAYSFLRFKENKVYKTLYIISTALSVYTHIYAGFIILSQGIFAILRKQIKVYVFSFLLIGILFLPLFIAPSFYGSDINWMTKPTISAILSTFFLLGGDFLPLSIVTSLLLAYALVKKTNLFLELWLFTPIICSLAISFVKPIYEPVYFIVCLPPYLLLISNVINGIEKRKMLILLLSCIIVLSGFRLLLWYTSNPQEFFASRIKYLYLNNVNEDWKDATKYVTVHAKRGDIVTFYGYFGKIDYEFYAQPTSPRVVEISSGLYNMGGGSELPEPNIALISSFTTQTVWFITNRNTGAQFNSGKQYGLIESLLKKHYKKIQVVQFPGVGVEKFSYK